MSVTHLLRYAPLIALLLGLFGSPLSAVAQDHDPRLAAIRDRWAGNDVACDYVYTRSANEEPEITERHSISGEWRLLAVDGQPPTPEEADAYYSEASRQARERRSAPVFKLGEYVDFESAAVQSEDNGTLTISYSPRAKDSEEDMLVKEMNAKMRGQLVVEKPSLRPLVMNLELMEPVTIAVPPVRVSEYRERRSFVVDPGTDALLVRSFELLSRGRAFVVKKVGNSWKHEYEYSECRFVSADEA